VFGEDPSDVRPTCGFLVLLAEQNEHPSGVGCSAGGLSGLGVSRMQVDQALAEMNDQKGTLDQPQYNLDHATIVAPSDGYVVNLQLRPGAFIRLKAPVMDFVSREDLWLIAVTNQKASRWIREGNEAEVAFDMYPDSVFPAKVDAVVFATGRPRPCLRADC
jgi:multidrug resistance efflux pump